MKSTHFSTHITSIHYLYPYTFAIKPKIPAKGRNFFRNYIYFYMIPTMCCTIIDEASCT